MIDRHYHYYWNIMLSFGIIKIIIASILLIYSKVTPKENLGSSFIYFLEYFQDIPTKLLFRNLLFTSYYSLLLMLYKF